MTVDTSRRRVLSKLVAILLSLALVASMLMGMAPIESSVPAAGCTHAHSEDCGYDEATPCIHVCDGSCGGLEPAEIAEASEVATIGTEVEVKDATPTLTDPQNTEALVPMQALEPFAAGETMTFMNMNGTPSAIGTQHGDIFAGTSGWVTYYLSTSGLSAANGPKNYAVTRINGLLGVTGNMAVAKDQSAQLTLTIPDSLVAGAYENLTLQVTTDNGDTVSSSNTFTLIVSNATGIPSSNKDIMAFTIPHQVGETGIAATPSAGSISLTMPYGTDVSSLAPAITHTGKSISPASGAPQDFSNPVPYVVTAEDNTVKTFIVTVNVVIASTVTVNDSYTTVSGAGSYAQGETVTIHAGSRSGYNFNGWTVNSGDVTLANTNSATTTFVMPAHAVTVSAGWTQIVPPPTISTVTINDSYAAVSGAGSYAQGETVTIHAGSRSGYYFSGWTVNSGGVTLAAPYSATTTFAMPETAVSITATWTSTLLLANGAAKERLLQETQPEIDRLNKEIQELLLQLELLTLPTPITQTLEELRPDLTPKQMEWFVEFMDSMDWKKAIKDAPFYSMQKNPFMPWFSLNQDSLPSFIKKEPFGVKRDFWESMYHELGRVVKAYNIEEPEVLISKFLTWEQEKAEALSWLQLKFPGRTNEDILNMIPEWARMQKVNEEHEIAELQREITQKLQSVNNITAERDLKITYIELELVLLNRLPWLSNAERALYESWLERTASWEAWERGYAYHLHIKNGVKLPLNRSYVDATFQFEIYSPLIVLDVSTPQGFIDSLRGKEIMGEVTTVRVITPEQSKMLDEIKKLVPDSVWNDAYMDPKSWEPGGRFYEAFDPNREKSIFEQMEGYPGPSELFDKKSPYYILPDDFPEWSRILLMSLAIALQATYTGGPIDGM